MEREEKTSHVFGWDVGLHEAVRSTQVAKAMEAELLVMPSIPAEPAGKYPTVSCIQISLHSRQSAVSKSP